VTAATQPIIAPAVSGRRRFVFAVSRRNRGALAAGVVLGLLFLLALLANVVTPYDFDQIDLLNRRAPPSWKHWFGTDELGRDLLTRVLFGARVSLAIGVMSALMSAFIGMTVGGIAGYAGRWIGDALMRFTDAMLSIPRLPLLMIAGAVLEPSVPALIALVGLVGWMETARVVRADVQSIKARDHVSAAIAMGATPLRLIARHILPLAFPAATVATTIAVGRGILLESALSFFGVGVQPPTASWGNMLYQAQTTMSSEPWLGIFPGVFIFLTVLCFNVIGDALSAARSSGR
jgi:peptide/nickel transport system permease protein